MISTKGRYALRAMIDIARYSSLETLVTIKDISKRENISIKYLEHIISSMIHAGLLVSLRGNNGGYRLSKDPKKITAYDVLVASEGTLAPVQCLVDENYSCSRCSICSTVNKSASAYLASVLAFAHSSGFLFDSSAAYFQLSKFVSTFSTA